MRNFLLVAAVTCCAFSAAAGAATITDVTGKVSVNRGYGFAGIGNGTSVKPGDLVMAHASGGASVVYDDGCKQIVNSATVIKVRPTSPCKDGARPIAYVLGAAAIAGGIGAAIALSDHDHNPPASP